jgi:hypothetical protein
MALANSIRPDSDRIAVPTRRRYLTELELSALSGYSPRTLQGWRLRDQGPPFKRVRGASIRYDLESFLQWMDAQPGGGELLDV